MRLLSFVCLAVGTLLCAGTALLAAEEFRPPAIVLSNARLIVRPGQVIERGHLLIRNGIIETVSPDLTPPPDAQVIDLAGMTITSGWIDAGHFLLVNAQKQVSIQRGRPLEVSRSALAATPLDNRRGLTPEYEVGSDWTGDDALVQQFRQQGFTAVHLLPNGRIASGQGSLFALNSQPPREANLSPTTLPTIHLAPLGQGGYPITRMGALAHLRQALLDAEQQASRQRLYDQNAPGISRPADDDVLKSLHTWLEKKPRCLFRADTIDEIHRSLDFAAEWKLPAVIFGGRDAARCLERLKQTGTPVILTVNWGDEPKIEPQPMTETLTAERKEPVRIQQAAHDLWKERLTVASRLHEAGVPFAFSSEGIANAADYMNRLKLLLKHGLTADALLAGLTIAPAEMLGESQRMGTLSAGQLANLTILSGPLDQDQTRLRHLMIEGQMWEFNADSTGPGGKGSKENPLTGDWQVEIETADGVVSGTLQLTQNDNALGGVFRSAQGEGKLSAGKREPKSLSFTVAIGAGLQTLELKFSGNVDADNPDRISGSLKSAFGAATKWSATRKSKPKDAPQGEANKSAKGEAPKNAVKLTLDDMPEAANVKSDTAAEEEAQAKSKSSPESKSENKPDPKSTPKADDSPAAAGVDAKPTVAKIEPAPGDWATELPTDRLQRPQPTGGRLLITHATVLTGVGEPLVDTSILISGGKIRAIGKELTPEPEMTVIDAAGRYVMPGIIDTHSHIMFQDRLGGVNEHSQSIVCEVRVSDVIRSDDPAAYRALAGGVTTIRMLHGSANVIGGQDAVVKLKFGRPAKEQLLEGAHPGVKFALGENVKFQDGRFPNTRLGVEATLQRAFAEAWEYRRQWQAYRRQIADQAPEIQAKVLAPRRDLRLEALADILDQQRFIHSHCYRADEILMLLRVASGYGLRVWSLQHVLEGYKVAPEIAAHRASCSTFSDWWAYKIEAYDATPYATRLMLDAGINVCLKSDDAELMRHMWQEAAKMLRYGDLSPEQALRLITLHPARELGLEARIGSIEVGKDADLAVFSGHPLNAFSRCETTIIDGEIYFQRESQPTAMLPASAKESGKVNSLPALNAELRRLPLTIPSSLGGVPGEGTIVPAVPQVATWAVRGAVIHTMEEPPYEQGRVLIQNGKIAAIGREIPLPENIPIVEANGLHVYPGLIDAGSSVGLYEIGKARETHDSAETGDYQPDLRAAVAVNPESELLAVTRAGGITSTFVRPIGGTICGQGSVIGLAGWTVPEMTLNYEAGLRINWPGGTENQPAIERLTRFLRDARTYLQLKDQTGKAGVPGPIPDPRYDALAPYLSGQKPVFISAQGRKEIAEALLFAEKEKLRMILTGGADAWKLADELKKRNIPVILGPVMAAPHAEHDPFDASYANAGRLHAAGVTVAFQSDTAANSRNLPFEAAMAVAYGLPAEIAEQGLTITSAKLLGVEEQIGSLRVGKQADFVLCDGSPLQPATMYKGIVIRGRLYRPESRHTRLYDKYRVRLDEWKQSQPKP